MSFASLCVRAAAMLACCLPACAAFAKPTLEDYGALADVSKVAISPGGDLVAFHKNSAAVNMLAVYSFNDKKLVGGLNVTDLNVRSVYFINNEQVVFVGYQNKRVSGYRDRFDMSTAFAFNPKTNDSHQLLTPGKVVYTGQTGLGRIVGISPDNKHVFMPAYVDNSGSRSNPDYSLVRTRLDKFGRPRVVRKGSDATQDYFMNSDGEVIAEERYNERNNQLSIYAKHGKEWQKVLEKEEVIRQLAFVGVTPDAQSLVVIDTSPTTGRDAYYTMSLKDGKFSGPIFERADADIEGIITDINRVVYGVRYSGFQPSYQFFEPEKNTLTSGLIETFPGQSVWLVDWSEDWKSIIVYVEGNGYVGEYFRYQNDTMTFLASSRPNIKQNDIHPVTKFQYKARDGRVIPALVTVPRQYSNKMENLPTIVMPHGGPASYDRLGFDWLSQAFANEGYLVLQPQFRGSRGFGAEHEQAGFGEWGKKMQDDLSDGLAMLVKEKLADPQRVCIVGWSYGGYAALAGGAFSPELYQCVVSVNGVSDLPKMMQQERRDHGRYHWVISYWEQVMANNQADKELLQKASPAYFAERFQAPVLLLHGERDDVVNIDQAKIMHKRLKAANKDVSFIAYEDDNHSLTESDNRIPALQAMVGFVEKHIGAAASQAPAAP